MKNKILLVLGIVIFVGAAAAIGAFSALPSRSMSWGNSVNTGGIIGFIKNIIHPSSVSIVIFGHPGVAYNGGSLTDSIVVVHFDPDRSTLSTVSIPRDLWISDEKEQFKINEGLHKNKIPVVMEKIEEMTGFSLDGYVIVDLTMVKQVIDYMGGVDIVLKEPATDWVSGYTMEPGTHHLNGEDAVWLMRNRYNPQGDFFRESNQQAVLKALFEKFKKLSKTDKLSFFNKFVFKGEFLKNVQIDFSKLTPYVFESQATGIQTKSVVLDFTTKLFRTSSIPQQGGQYSDFISVLIPAEGFEKYDAIQKYIQDKLTK